VPGLSIYVVLFLISQVNDEIQVPAVT